MAPLPLPRLYSANAFQNMKMGSLLLRKESSQKLSSEFQ